MSLIPALLTCPSVHMLAAGPKCVDGDPAIYPKYSVIYRWHALSNQSACHFISLCSDGQFYTLGCNGKAMCGNLNCIDIDVTGGERVQYFHLSVDGERLWPGL